VGKVIEDEGAIALANGLRNHESLKFLDLGENCIGDRSAVGLADILRRNSVLKVLWLHNLSLILTEEGRKVLACAIQYNSGAEELSLWNDDCLDCPWFQHAGFFNCYHSIHIWDVIQRENAMIPWHKALYALLCGTTDLERNIDRVTAFDFEGDVVQRFRLSMVFLLLQNRPDIVRWRKGP